jgi:hypothetical protein
VTLYSQVQMSLRQAKQEYDITSLKSGFALVFDLSASRRVERVERKHLSRLTGGVTCRSDGGI